MGRSYQDVILVESSILFERAEDYRKYIKCYWLQKTANYIVKFDNSWFVMQNTGASFCDDRELSGPHPSMDVAKIHYLLTEGTT